MLDWTKVQVTEPPLTEDISDADIRLYVKNGGESALEFPRFPCHTQTVERCVKVVTDASMSVCGPESRDGFIRSCLELRRIMPVFILNHNIVRLKYVLRKCVSDMTSGCGVFSKKFLFCNVIVSYIFHSLHVKE